jgi:fatty acid elongase 3
MCLVVGHGGRDGLRNAAAHYRRGRGSWEWYFCEKPGTIASGPLYFWSYIYYISKFYELADTLIQLYKGRKIPHFFMHVYHHTVVIFMAWGWLEYAQTLQVGPNCEI